MKHAFIALALLALTSCGKQDVADRGWHEDNYHHRDDDYYRDRDRDDDYYYRDRGTRGHRWWPHSRSSNQK
ncbi:MAG TPA: hypothetical protein VLG44_04270 [Chlamydiales bacterium]|nr:hypothetical protein [Chlamydiales bacterium]